MVLKHTAVRVADVDREVEFYERYFDYEIVRSFTSPDGTRNVFVGPSEASDDVDGTIQLVESEGPIDTGDFEHLALGVEDVDDTVARLSEDHVREEPTTIDDDGVRVAFAEDPEGWGIELIEVLE